MKITIEIPENVFDEASTNEAVQLLNEIRLHCMLAMLSAPGSPKTIGLLLGQLAIIEIVKQLQNADKLAQAAMGDTTSVAE